MKTLKLAKNDYGLRVFCSKCDTNYNHDKLYRCKHYQHQKYKQIIYRKSGAKTKTYQSRDFDTVLMASINFKKQVLNSSSVKIAEQPDENTLTLIDAVNYYLDYKDRVNIPFPLLHKKISKKHFDDIERNLKYLVEAIRSYSNDEPKDLLFKDLNEYHIGYWAEFLNDNFSEGSWNLRNSILKSFSSYIIKKFKIRMYDPFEDIGRVNTEGKKDTINKEDFNAVLDAIDTKDKYEKMNGKQEKIYRYRDYLKDAFLIALHTGLRREEYLTLTWQDLQLHNNQWLIVVDNKKVERITGKKFKPKVVVIHEELESILLNLGWKSKNIESSSFIIKPERTANIKTMEMCCTAAFSHYYKCAFPNKKHKTLGALRNTYLSCLNRETGNNMIELSSHGSMKTLIKHYIDPKLIAKAANMKIFG